MQEFLKNLYKDVATEAGTSFIFGATTAAFKALFTNSSNAITAQTSALRKSLEQTKYAMTYTAISACLSRLYIRKSFAVPASLFLTSYITGLRNGVPFALKNGLFGLLMNLLNHLYY